MAKLTAQPKSARQRKAEIMKNLGLTTTEQYNKQYDIFRNKVRAFERLTGQKVKDSVAYLFHDYAYRKGRGLKLTEKQKAILSTASYSSGKKLKEVDIKDVAKALGAGNLQEAAAAISKLKGQKGGLSSLHLLQKFAGLFERSPKHTAKILMNASSVSDAIKQLADYADKIHAKQRRTTKGKKDGDAFPGDYYED